MSTLFAPKKISRMQTPAQKQASEENWAIFQLKGIRSNLNTLMFRSAHFSPSVRALIRAAIRILTTAEEFIKQDQLKRKTNNHERN